MRIHFVRLLATLGCSVAVTSLAHAATVTGRVVDPDTRAVARARVVVTDARGAVAETQTDAQGAYAIRDLPDGHYEVRVWAPGFDAAPARLDIRGDESRDVAIQLHVSALQEAIVVSASHVERARTDTPSSVTVITGDDLRARQVETVADALRDVPGLSVVRSGGRGGLTSVFPRGGSSNYTLVLVDGVRANSFGGGFDFAHLSVANVDRIEIVRGPQSALYGSEAIGAVVQVITRRGGAPTMEGVLEGGSLGTARMAIGTAGSHRAWSWGFGAERVSTDGYTGPTASGETVSNDDYARTQATGTLGYRSSTGLDAVLVAGLAQDERGFPGPWGANPIGVFPGVDRLSRGDNDGRRVGVRVSHPWSTSLRQRVDVTYADLTSNFVSAFGPSSSGTRRFNGRLQEDLAVATRAAVSMGAEIVRERGRFDSGSAGTPTQVNRQNIGLFVEQRLSAGARWDVTAGLRYEHIVREGMDPDPTAFQPRPALPRQRIGSLNPKVGLMYRAAGAAGGQSVTRVRASAGTGIRPPDVFEIAFTDNANLRPERSRSLDVGVEQQLMSGTLVIDGAVFANHYDDLIVTVGRAWGNVSRYRTDNVANARARGVELSALARLPLGLRAAATYTRLSTAMLSVDSLGGTAPNPFAVGDPLIRRPRHQGTVDLRYTGIRATAFATVTTRARAMDIEPNYGSFGGVFFTPGYAVVDVGGSVPVRRGLELFARVDNVANRRYEETLGFPALGRTGIVGIRVAARR
jgi:outer membrane cobalamin receptor